ncbi:hypothetical protein SBX64_11305 [Vibrio rhizosphaerae]|uniref:Uncharacterized protein n=1 Tax=Vibrio rhizosphaerae TaxID=398736 RepID=A0ABU4IUQ5_9VIBR|nr:hypothetical protein [Vibrio rhizosphaerae]MDW6093137.1 hypothetical protein [Vibrio rhizosphaerae]
MSTETTAEMLNSVNRLTETVIHKITEIDTAVVRATTEVKETITNQTIVDVYVDAEHGDDSHDGISAPYKTLNAALTRPMPYGSYLNVQLLSNVDITSEIKFNGRHVVINLREHTLNFPSLNVYAPSGTIVGTGLASLRGTRDATLVICNGAITTGDAISNNQGNQWFYHLNRTMIQMGGIDIGPGIYTVTLNRLSITLGQNIIGLSGGYAGANIYPGQGMIHSTMYGTTIDVSATNATMFGYGVNIRNNVFIDNAGNTITGTAA